MASSGAMAFSRQGTGLSSGPQRWDNGQRPVRRLGYGPNGRDRERRGGKADTLAADTRRGRKRAGVILVLGGALAMFHGRLPEPLSETRVPCRFRCPTTCGGGPCKSPRKMPPSWQRSSTARLRRWSTWLSPSIGREKTRRQVSLSAVDTQYNDSPVQHNPLHDSLIVSQKQTTPRIRGDGLSRLPCRRPLAYALADHLYRNSP